MHVSKYSMWQILKFFFVDVVLEAKAKHKGEEFQKENHTQRWGCPIKTNRILWTKFIFFFELHGKIDVYYERSTLTAPSSTHNNVDL